MHTRKVNVNFMKKPPFPRRFFSERWKCIHVYFVQK